jgi:bifunctional oligoribonuclease and PAP phosphatase NrnA
MTAGFAGESRLGDEVLAKAAAAIVSARSVALACHVVPDGDALGSMLALHHVLRAADRPSIAAFAGPQVVGPHYREIPGLDTISDPSQFPAEPEVMITLDCGSLGRLGDLAGPAQAAKELVVIDHHLSNDHFGSINLIDPDAAASAVVVARLIDTLGLPLNRDAAVCLYAALVCDTGRFQYESTGIDAFNLARRLLDFDVPVARLNRTLFEEHRLAYLRLVGEVLARARLVEEKSFIWAAISQADLARHDVAIEETEGLIDYVRQAREAQVSCVLKEEGDGGVRVSLRSLGSVDVSAVASHFGGGGHRYAAGFTAPRGPAEAVVEAILGEL